MKKYIHISILIIEAEIEPTIPGATSRITANCTKGLVMFYCIKVKLNSNVPSDNKRYLNYRANFNMLKKRLTNFYEINFDFYLAIGHLVCSKLNLEQNSNGYLFSSESTHYLSSVLI